MMKQCATFSLRGSSTEYVGLQHDMEAIGSVIQGVVQLCAPQQSSLSS